MSKRKNSKQNKHRVGGYGKVSKQSTRHKVNRHSPIADVRKAVGKISHIIFVEASVRLDRSDVVPRMKELARFEVAVDPRKSVLSEVNKRMHPKKYSIQHNTAIYFDNDHLKSNLFGVVVTLVHDPNADVSCPSMMKKKECKVHRAMKEDYEFSESNLQHMQKYQHFNNLDESKPECKYGDQCRAFIRLQKGGNRLDDLCHLEIYRHPPRNRCIETVPNLNHSNTNTQIKNEFKMSKSYSGAWEAYKPTSEEQLLSHEKVGYLKFLLQEVIDNGFENDLYINGDEEKDKNNPSILKIVNEKMMHEKHIAMGCPLNRAEMLSLILYTGCEVNWYFSEDQRNGKYDKWKWMDFCMWHALHKLGKREIGEYTIWSGLRNVQLPSHGKTGFSKTYISCSWNKNVAIEFIKIKDDAEQNIDDGMLIQIQRTADLTVADVSWISKFKDECEVLVRRGEYVNLTVHDQMISGDAKYQIVKQQSLWHYKRSHKSNHLRYEFERFLLRFC